MPFFNLSPYYNENKITFSRIRIPPVSFHEKEFSDEINIHPYPFSKSVTIDIKQNNPGLTQITIYKHLSEQIKLIEQIQSAGKQQVIWNAEGFPAGVYFCVLKTDNGMQTMKMIKLN